MEFFPTKATAFRISKEKEKEDLFNQLKSSLHPTPILIIHRVNSLK